MARKKVLLMGKARSGKTSMRSIIFANYLARDTMRLSPTLDVEHHHVRFLGDLVLNLWDCGGQDAFYESYFERDRETIFRSVEMLIYVFDIESDCPEKDFDHFAGVLEAIEENSPDARIFVLVHKMDLVAEDERDMILQDRKRLIEESCTQYNFHFQCFGTSIWDETLYKAWSEIVTTLIPNIGVLESHLRDFCRMCDADEVVLFEKATFLVISHSHYNSNDTRLDATDHEHTTRIDASDALGSSSHATMEHVADNTNDRLRERTTSSSTPHSKSNTGIEDEVTLNNRQNHHNFLKSLYHNPIVSARKNRNVLHFDAHRFEKISNIIKQFKLSCGKAQSQFSGMELCNAQFSAYIDAFTANTYIMVIVSSPHIPAAATLLNIKNARKHFERFIPRS
jgi:Ras-related GTP-binding protein A/B